MIDFLPSLSVEGEPMLHVRGRDHLVSPAWPIMMHSAVRNENSVLHDHDFLEIAFIVGGSGTHCSQAGAMAASAGDVFVVRPGHWHIYRDCRRLHVQNCCFESSFLAREFPGASHNILFEHLFMHGPLARERGGVLHLHLDNTALRASRQHLRVLFEAGKDDAPALRLMWSGHFLLLAQQLAALLDLNEVEQESRTQRVHPAVREGMRLLSEHIAYSWTLKELAARVHLNPSYVVRLFKSATGMAPLTFLARRRAEEAATLLVRSDLTVAEIGARVGWRDPSYFSQRFKAHYGLSAGAYRARYGHHAQSLDS